MNIDAKIVGDNSADSLANLKNLTLETKTQSDTQKTESPDSLDFAGIKGLANKLFSQNKYDEALEKYNEAELKAIENKDKGAIFHNKGMTYEALDKNELALEEYNKALQLIPDYYKVLRRRAKLYIHLEEFEKAKSDLKPLLILEKDNFGEVNVETSNLVSVILSKLGCAMALKLMDKIAENPKAPRKEDIDVFFRSFIFDPVSLMWSGKEIAPVGSDESAYSAAVKALKAQDYEPIISLCTDEIKNPESECLYYSHLLRGTMKLLWGYGKETLEDFEAIVSASTDKRVNNKLQSNAALKMALFYLRRTGDGDMIQKYFDLAETLWKENCDVYNHCAMMLVEADSPKNVNTMFDKAAEVYGGEDYPMYFQTFRLAIKACMAAEDCPESLEAEFAKIKELEARFDTPECYDVYANALLLKGSAKETEELYKRAIEKFPEFPSFRLKKALVQYPELSERSAMKAFLEDLYKFVEVDDQYQVLYFHIANAELRLGNVETGFQHLRKSIELTRNIDEAVQRATVLLGYETHYDLCNQMGLDPWGTDQELNFGEIGE